ncbi:MAG: radical SAM protein, partial [Crenarchaeota archaeon]|nr:radical SAM protein [Thermoproteota archaeon]
MASEVVFLASIELTTRCSHGCPFCYARRRYSGHAEWSVGRLRLLLGELAGLLGAGGFVAVYGGGEPLEAPGLLAEALEAALEAGAAYVSFTTSGAPIHGLEELLSQASSLLHLPRGFVTVSIDSYKLVAGPRALGGVDEELLAAWRDTRPLLLPAARRWGVELPLEPPALLQAVTLLREEGCDIAINIMLTDDILPLLAWGARPSPLLEALAEASVQVNLLAPKPLHGLLTVDQETGRLPEAYASTLRRLASTIKARLALDQSMLHLLGMKPPGADEGRACNAG